MSLRDQCRPCPWRDVDAIAVEFPDVIEHVKAGGAVVCHTRCGICDGPSYAGVTPAREDPDG